MLFVQGGYERVRRRLVHSAGSTVARALRTLGEEEGHDVRARAHTGTEEFSSAVARNGRVVGGGVLLQDVCAGKDEELPRRVMWWVGPFW